MNDNRAITVRPDASFPSPQVWQMIVQMGEQFVKSGLLPDTIKTGAAAALIILKGRELGIPATYACNNIVVIKGKSSCSAELMLALIYRDHGDEAIKFVESSTERCTVEYRRRAWLKSERYSFTKEDAMAAGLWGQGTWKAYPKALLRARCISAVARMAFPDSIGGMYTPEELGARVVIDESGEMQFINADAVDVETDEIMEGEIVQPPAPPKPPAKPVSRPAPAPADAEENKIAQLRQQCAGGFRALAKNDEQARKKFIMDHIGKPSDQFTLADWQLLTTILECRVLMLKMDMSDEAVLGMRQELIGADAGQPKTLSDWDGIKTLLLDERAHRQEGK